MESLKKYIDCKYWKRKKATYFAFLYTFTKLSIKFSCE